MQRSRPPWHQRMVREQGGFILVFEHRFLFREVPGGIRLRTSCPGCRQAVEMVEKQPYRQFILSWIPLWKVKKGERCLECPSCRARFFVPEPLRPKAAVGEEEELEGPGL